MMHVQNHVKLGYGHISDACPQPVGFGQAYEDNVYLLLPRSNRTWQDFTIGGAMGALVRWNSLHIRPQVHSFFDFWLHHHRNKKTTINHSMPKANR